MAAVAARAHCPAALTLPVRLDECGFRDRRCGLARTDLVQRRILCQAPLPQSGRHRRSLPSRALRGSRGCRTSARLARPAAGDVTGNLRGRLLLFFTAIHLKRRGGTPVHIMAPLALFAVAALYRLIPPRLAGPACFLFGLGVFAYGTTAVAVPRVDGHKAAAAWSPGLGAEGAPTIMFHGQRSASFIFNLPKSQQPAV